MRLMLPSAGGSTEHSMSFPTKNRPLPPVPTPSASQSQLHSSSKAQPAKEWSPLASVPASNMGPSQQPQPGRISDSQFEINQNVVRPTTVDGAVDWINRHKPQIDQFLNILEQYPQLVQSDRVNTEKHPLPPIKRSFSESAAFPPKLHENKLQRQSRLGGRFGRRKHLSGENNGNKTSTIKGDENTRRDDLIAGERYIYVCDVLSESNESLDETGNTIPSPSLPSAREKIVTALSSYCFVRTGPDRLHSEAEFVELTHTIANADAFILLMNSRVLASGTCYHQLAVAASYSVPIISVRESGFKLTEPLSPELGDIEIIPRRIRATTAETQEIRTDILSDRLSSRDKTDLHESQSSGFHSDTEGEDNAHPNLADLVTNCYNDSLLYVPNFHNSCISKLLGKLSEYLGEAYLDYEVSQQLNGDATALINDRMTIPRIGNVAKTIAIPSLNNISSKSTRTFAGEFEINMPLKGDIANLPETPMSTDRSTGTPNSFSKLPPISKPSAPTGKSNTKNDKQKTEVQDTGNNSDRLSLDESMDARESQYTAQSSILDSDWDSTPDPDSFMETNYIVFPSNDLGFEKRPPFTVNFPRDISTIDRRRSSTSTDEYGFNQVQLDFRYDIIAPSPVGFSFFDEEEEEEKAKKPAPKKEPKPRVKKPPKPIQVKVRNNRPVKEQQLVKMATISIKYGMPV